jgi:hypothetical protein
LADPVLIVRDDRFLQHLQNVPHLEGPKRVRALQEALEDPSLKGRWREISPRMATTEELAWVHTPEHIERVAGSADRPLTSFDLDTQATARSYDVARLAVGGVFSLLDEIWGGRAKRGHPPNPPPPPPHPGGGGAGGAPAPPPALPTPAPPPPPGPARGCRRHAASAAPRIAPERALSRPVIVNMVCSCLARPAAYCPKPRSASQVCQ